MVIAVHDAPVTVTLAGAGSLDETARRQVIALAPAWFGREADGVERFSEEPAEETGACVVQHDPDGIDLEEVAEDAYDRARAARRRHCLPLVVRRVALTGPEGRQ